MSWKSEVNPQPGDLIEIFRTACQHWAIYVGNGYVVHLVPEGNHSGSDIFNLLSFGISGLGSYGTSSLGSVMRDHAEVKMEPLWKVAKNGYQVNNKYDAKYNPRPVNEIISEVKAAVGRKMPFNLFNNNCEHFVTKLRYGIPVSDQVDPVQVTNGLTAAAGQLVSDPQNRLVTCTAICTAAFCIAPISTVAIAGGALLLREIWRRR